MAQGFSYQAAILPDKVAAVTGIKKADTYFPASVSPEEAVEKAEKLCRYLDRSNFFNREKLIITYSPERNPESNSADSDSESKSSESNVESKTCYVSCSAAKTPDNKYTVTLYPDSLVTNSVFMEAVKYGYCMAAINEKCLSDPSLKSTAKYRQMWKDLIKYLNLNQPVLDNNKVRYFEYAIKNGDKKIEEYAVSREEADKLLAEYSDNAGKKEEKASFSIVSGEELKTEYEKFIKDTIDSYNKTFADYTSVAKEMKMTKIYYVRNAIEKLELQLAENKTQMEDVKKAIAAAAPLKIVHKNLGEGHIIVCTSSRAYIQCNSDKVYECSLDYLLNNGMLSFPDYPNIQSSVQVYVSHKDASVRLIQDIEKLQEKMFKLKKIDISKIQDFGDTDEEEKTKENKENKDNKDNKENKKAKKVSYKFTDENLKLFLNELDSKLNRIY